MGAASQCFEMTVFKLGYTIVMFVFSFAYYEIRIKNL